MVVSVQDGNIFSGRSRRGLVFPVRKTFPGDKQLVYSTFAMLLKKHPAFHLVDPGGVVLNKIQIFRRE